jgi:MarR family transcriptional regulator, organic hydroperoxide resistance regulator
MSELSNSAAGRKQLETELLFGLRNLTCESDWLARSFARNNCLSANDFRALIFVIIADKAGDHLTAGELRRRMGLSGAAITYQIDRMTESGHLRKRSHPTDRRKVVLTHTDRGMAVARTFLTKISNHSHDAFGDLTDNDLEAAHRSFSACIEAMRAFRALDKQTGLDR